MKINTKLAKSISNGAKRKLTDVKYIVIHYTGNSADTAKNNADYFATGNTRSAGAHFFVDQAGEVWKSINMSRTAYAVGGKYSLSAGAGTYYGKCTNANSVSVELCDCCTDAGWAQTVATRWLVKYIQKKCPNAKTIIRHWDVNGKECPAPMAGKDNKKWTRFHNYLTKGYQLKGKVTKKAATRSTGRVTPFNRIGTMDVGTTVYITKIAGNWGRLKKKSKAGKYRWIILSKIKEI